MVILDQSMTISLYLKMKKKRKFKNSTFVNLTFIIHENGNNTCIQPILKSNSTSFMFNYIFCEMNIKKVIYTGGAGDMGEPSKFKLLSEIPSIY